MKILLFVLLTFGSSLLTAQESDYALVEQTVNYYLEGGTNNDFETLKKAFHENASMKYLADGYKEVNAINFFEKGIKAGPPQNRKTRIVNIRVTGHAASAQLEIEYSNFTFIDHMNLLKIDGEWKIVSKIFYRRNHKEEEKG